MPTVTVKKGDALVRRRTGIIREVAGFTTKPKASAPSDGVKRVRMIVPGDPQDETRVRLDQINKTYQPLGW